MLAREPNKCHIPWAQISFSRKVKRSMHDLKYSYMCMYTMCNHDDASNEKKIKRKTSSLKICFLRGKQFNLIFLHALISTVS